jgi:hypothetical protein
MGLNVASSREHPNSRCRQTVHGLASNLAQLVDPNYSSCTREAVKWRIAQAGLPLDALIELDEDIDAQADASHGFPMNILAAFLRQDHGR